MNRLNILIAFAFALFFIIPAQGQIFKQGTMNSRQVQNLPNYDYAPYHFGFILALNQMYFAYTPVDNYQTTPYFGDNVPQELDKEVMFLNAIEHKSHTGFTVGIVGNLRMTKYTDLRFTPSMSFGSRELIYYFKDTTSTNTSMGEVIKKPLSSYLVDIPFHIKYKSKRIHNMRAYVIGGGKYSIDLANQNRQAKILGEENPELMKLNRHGFSFEIGAGMDFYAYFFKFGIEAKMSYGLNDILKRTHHNHPYIAGIKELNSKIFQLSFTFE